MSDTANDFSKGSIVSNIMKLAVPMTMAQLINVLYNIIDRIYIGRIPENATLALTGLGLCLPIISMVIAFANLFGMGGAPLCSIERGRGNKEEAELIMGNSFVLMVIFGIGLTVVGLALKKPMLYLFGASDNTYPYADQYISIYLLGSIFVMIGLGMNSFINSQGFGTIGMMTVLLGAVANIILDPIFIFTFHMGVRGAALATILSQFLSALWIVKFLTGGKAILRLKTSAFRLKKQRVKNIVALGMSGFTMAITNSSVQIMYNASLQHYGGDLYVGIMTVINSVREIISMPVNGLTNSAQPVMGFNYGAGEYKRVNGHCIHFGGLHRLYDGYVAVCPWLSGILYPHLQSGRGSGQGRNSGHADLLFRLFHDVASVRRPIRVCGAGKSEECGVLLDFQESDHRDSAYAGPSSDVWTGNRRRAYGGTGVQLYRRGGLLHHDADYGVAGAQR